MGFSSNGSCSSNLFYILVKHSIYLSHYKYTEYWIERSTTKAIVLVVDKIDYMQSIVETFGPTATILGGGFFVGVLIGYALKKVIKIVAVVVGLFLAGLAYLQYHQIANINWNKLQQVLSEGVLQHFQMRLLYRFQVLVMVVVPIFMPCNSLLICDDQLGIPLT